VTISLIYFGLPSESLRRRLAVGLAIAQLLNEEALLFFEVSYPFFVVYFVNEAPSTLLTKKGRSTQPGGEYAAKINSLGFWRLEFSKEVGRWKAGRKEVLRLLC
jgi:hypothetical protein